MKGTEPRYVVGGSEWPGSLAAMSAAFRATHIPPVKKLLLIGFANCAMSVDEAAEWAEVERAKAQRITDELLKEGRIGQYGDPEAA